MPKHPTRRDVLQYGSAALLTAFTSRLATVAEPRRRHVLNIAVDDLRTTLGCYGDPHAITPNIDALARRGTLFEHAYVQQAVCSASRASLLTGLRPSATGVSYPYNPRFRDIVVPENPTFPTWFEQHGAWSRMVGKIHHQWQNELETLDARSPKVNVPGQGWQDYVLPENQHLANDKDPATLPPPLEAAPVEDSGYADGRIADHAVGWLRQYARELPAEPLFLSVGFKKPHLPFNAPQRYFDLYDPAGLPDFRTPPPDDAPGYTRASYELGDQYAGRHAEKNAEVDEVTARRLTHAYYACVSYVDAQIGRVLTALQDTGLAADTVVVLWSDHGFHLGENQMWGKHVNYETATRAPLLFAGPGVPAEHRVPEIVEFLDIYPTLCDLTDTPRPDHLQGRSLLPLMQGNAPDWPQRAFSEYDRGPFQGRSVRVPGWRYVQWTHRDEGGVVAQELYDLSVDGPGESTNLAAARPDVADRLAALLPEAR